MLTWLDLVRMPDAELAELDLALVNLLCAVGLPDFPESDIERVVRRLDEWAGLVRAGTENSLPMFHVRPSEYEDSEGYFRTLVMVTVLMRNLGLRYNPAKIEWEVPLDTADMFVHGAVVGDGGTCGTIPVVLAAVARRLGYPVALMAAKYHCYARWTRGKEFNIEISGAGGLATPPDEHYLTGRMAMRPEAARACGVLRPLLPREELAWFLIHRGERWGDFGEFGQKAVCLAHAYEIAPALQMLPDMIALTVEQWHRKLQERLPPKPSFPGLHIKAPRKFPRLDDGMEWAIVSHIVMERLLDDEQMERAWWGPVRRGERVLDIPPVLQVAYNWD